MSPSESDPWGIELVPIRTRRKVSQENGNGHGNGTAAPADADDADLVRVTVQFARALDRINARLARIEKSLGIEGPIRTATKELSRTTDAGTQPGPTTEQLRSAPTTSLRRTADSASDTAS